MGTVRKVLRRLLDDAPAVILFGSIGFWGVSLLAGGGGCSNYTKRCENHLSTSYDLKRRSIPAELSIGGGGGTVTVTDGRVELVSLDGSLEVVWTIAHEGWAEDLWD